MLREDFFTGWTRHPMVDGFVLLPPGGLAAGPIRIREKLPLRPLRAFVDEALAESGAAIAEAARIGPLQRLITLEGENAGVVTVVFALPGGEALERTLALVAGDDLCTVIDGATARPDDFARYRHVIRDLAESYYLGLGELRRRRYEYTPPPGWEALARPYVTAWYAPGFPRTAAFISVFDARPHVGTPAEVEDRSLSIENARFDSTLHEQLSFPGGLEGRLEQGSGTQDGQRIHVVRARLGDGRFDYLIQLNAAEDALAAGRAAFDALLTSIEPIPRPSGAPSAHLMHWLD
jgi:hypothetical protein